MSRSWGTLHVEQLRTALDAAYAAAGATHTAYTDASLGERRHQVAARQRAAAVRARSAADDVQFLPDSLRFISRSKSRRSVGVIFMTRCERRSRSSTRF